MSKCLHQAFGLSSAAQRRLDPVAGSQSRLDERKHFIDLPARVQCDVDAVEGPPAAEDELRRVDVHHSDVAAKRLCHPLRSHDAADREILLSECRHQLNAVVLLEVIAHRKFPRDDDAVRLRKKGQRIRDRLVLAFHRILPHAPVAGHVHAQDEDVPLARVGGPHDCFDDGNRSANARNGARLVHGRFRNAGLSGRNLQHGFAGDLVNRFAQSESKRGIGGSHRCEDRNPQNDSQECQDVAQQMSAEFGDADLP